MTLSYNSTNFEDKNNSKIIHRDANSQMFKIKKSEFISKYKQDAGNFNIYNNRYR